MCFRYFEYVCVFSNSFLYFPMESFCTYIRHRVVEWFTLRPCYGPHFIHHKNASNLFQHVRVVKASPSTATNHLQHILMFSKQLVQLRVLYISSRQVSASRDPNLGPQTVGPQTVGSQIVGPQTVGSQSSESVPGSKSGSPKL